MTKRTYARERRRGSNCALYDMYNHISIGNSSLELHPLWRRKSRTGRSPTWLARLELEVIYQKTVGFGFIDATSEEEERIEEVWTKFGRNQASVNEVRL